MGTKQISLGRCPVFTKKLKNNRTEKKSRKKIVIIKI